MGKLTVVVGGQYGSEGKGAVVSHVALEHDIHVRVGSPNAGHTIYWNGEKHVMQSIPCGWTNPNATIIIGRGALINMEQFMKELDHIKKYYPDFLNRIRIDAEAGILDKKYQEEEGGTHGEMHRKIGSTGEGVGVARIARIKRDGQFRQFKHVAKEIGLEKILTYNTPLFIAKMQDVGENILIEGTQGSGLSLLHSHYPYCTSVDTNAAGIIAEVGIAPARVTDVLLVVRSYPIRVAGNSGYMKNEITWDELNKRIGRSITPERTTVTRKVRRIAEWDFNLFEQAVMLNCPTKIALTFTDYIDPDLYNCHDIEKIKRSSLLREFIDKNISQYKNLLSYIGTGPDTMVTIRR